MAIPIIIAYHKATREVLWWRVGEYIRNGNENTQRTLFAHYLFDRMEDYLVNGNTFEILEYHPHGWSERYFTQTLGERAKWWDDQLRQQGYDIYLEGIDDA